MAALTIFVTLYGVLGALSSLLQVRRMLFTRSSDDVSVLFLIIYCGGYIVWLVYGLIVADIALIVVDLVGMSVSLVTLTVALRMRMIEKGQSLWEAMRDEAGSEPPQFEWLGTTDDPVRKVPESLKGISYNRCYPVMTLKVGSCRDEVDAISEISLPDQKQKLFINMVTSWRVIDSPGAQEEDYQTWRQSLAESIDFAMRQPSRPSFISVANHELARPEHLPPTGARLSECRATSLFSASLALDSLSAHLRFARAEQIGSHRIDALSQRWAEQSLGVIALSEEISPTTSPELAKILEPLSAKLNPQRPVLLADKSWQALLWTAGAGADKPFFGGPDPIPYPVIPEAWVKERRSLELRRLALLATRPRDDQRIMGGSPLDRSINEGFASLGQTLLTSDINEEELWRLYPIERSFIVACASQAGMDEESLFDYLAETDFVDGSRALAALAGMSIDHFANIYQDSYLSVARSVFDNQEISQISQSRLIASWRAVLAR